MAFTRYDLRTLLIVLAVGPPILAGLYLDMTGLAVIGFLVVAFAMFWLLCGLIWLGIMRAFERLLGERRD